MKFLAPILAMVMMAFGAMAQPFAGVKRNSVTTNSNPSTSLSAGQGLIWDGVSLVWTNGTISASASNAISTINGRGSNTVFIITETNGTVPTVTTVAGGPNQATNIINLPWAGPAASGPLHSNDFGSFLAKQNTNTVWVSATGNDANAGTEASPLATPNAAVARLRGVGNIIISGALTNSPTKTISLNARMATNINVVGGTLYFGSNVVGSAFTSVGSGVYSVTIDTNLWATNNYGSDKMMWLYEYGTPEGFIPLDTRVPIYGSRDYRLPDFFRLTNGPSATTLGNGGYFLSNTVLYVKFSDGAAPGTRSVWLPNQHATNCAVYNGTNSTSIRFIGTRTYFARDGYNFTGIGGDFVAKGSTAAGSYNEGFITDDGVTPSPIFIGCEAYANANDGFGYTMFLNSRTNFPVILEDGCWAHDNGDGGSSCHYGGVVIARNGAYTDESREGGLTPYAGAIYQVDHCLIARNDIGFYVSGGPLRGDPTWTNRVTGVFGRNIRAVDNRLTFFYDTIETNLLIDCQDCYVRSLSSGGNFFASALAPVNHILRFSGVMGNTEGSIRTDTSVYKNPTLVGPAYYTNQDNSALNTRLTLVNSVNFGSPDFVQSMSNYMFLHQRAQFLMNDSGQSVAIEDGAFVRLRNGSSIQLGLNGTTNTLRIGTNSYITGNANDSEDADRTQVPGDGFKRTNTLVRWKDLEGITTVYNSNGVVSDRGLIVPPGFLFYEEFNYPTTRGTQIENRYAYGDVKYKLYNTGGLGPSIFNEGGYLKMSNAIANTAIYLGVTNNMTGSLTSSNITKSFVRFQVTTNISGATSNATVIGMVLANYTDPAIWAGDTNTLHMYLDTAAGTMNIQRGVIGLGGQNLLSATIWNNGPDAYRPHEWEVQIYSNTIVSKIDGRNFYYSTNDEAQLFTHHKVGIVELLGAGTNSPGVELDTWGVGWADHTMQFQDNLVFVGGSGGITLSRNNTSNGVTVVTINDDDAGGGGGALRIETNSVLVRSSTTNINFIEGPDIGWLSTNNTGANKVDLAPRVIDTELLEWAGISTNKFLTTNHILIGLVASNQVRVAAGSGITVTPAGSAGVMTYTVANASSAAFGGLNEVQYSDGSGNFRATNKFFWETNIGVLFLTASDSADEDRAFATRDTSLGVTNYYGNQGIAVHASGGNEVFRIFPKIPSWGAEASTDPYWQFQTNGFFPSIQNHADLGAFSLRTKTNWANAEDSFYANIRGTNRSQSLGVTTWTTNGISRPLIDGTNVLINGATGNYFEWNAWSTTNYAYRFTNIAVGQSIVINTWVTNGSTVLIGVDTTVPLAANWYYDGNVVNPRSNGWSRIEVYRKTDTSSTNITVDTTLFALVAGNNITFSTNLTTAEITITGSGSGATNTPVLATGFLDLTNQIYYRSTDYSGSPGWVLADFSGKSVLTHTNILNTNTTFLITNPVNGASLVWEVRANTLGTNFGINVNTNGSESAAIQVRWFSPTNTTGSGYHFIAESNYIYLLSMRCAVTPNGGTNVYVSWTTTSPNPQRGSISLVAAGQSPSNAVVGGTLYKAITVPAFTNLNATIATFTNAAFYITPAHTLTNNGDSIETIWRGNANAGTNNIKMIYGMSTILDTGTFTNGITGWEAGMEITRTGNTSAHIDAWVDFQQSTAAAVIANGGKFRTSLDLTVITNGIGLTNLLQLASNRAGCISNNYMRVSYDPASR
jgi:hypothetical protein